MTTITFYQDDKNLYKGFEASGHAGFKKSGSDIVCASISILTINTVNSLEKFTDAVITIESDEKSGYIKVLIENYEGKDIQLLLSSLYLGLSEIRDNYKKYLKLTNRRY